MEENMKKLSEICITVISKNLDTIREIYREKMTVKFGIGDEEKILNAYLQNSKVLYKQNLQFILNKSIKKNLTIYPTKFLNLKYLDFLNGNHLHYLKICNRDNFLYKNNHSSIIVDNLEIIDYAEKSNRINGEFFENFQIENSFIYNGCPGNWNYEVDYLNIISNKLSNNLEKIHINLVNLDKNTIRKLLMNLKEKIHLKSLYFNFCFSTLSSTHPTYLSNLTAKMATSVELEHRNFPNWDFKYGNILFESLECLQHISFSFPVTKKSNKNDFKNFFRILGEKTSKSLKSINFHFLNIDKIIKQFTKFLNNCFHLEKVIIKNKLRIDINLDCIWDSLFQTSINLKSIDICRGLKLENDIESIRNLLENCSLNEIYFVRYNLKYASLKEILIGLRNSKNSLKSMEFFNCNLRTDQLELVGDYLNNLHGLEKFVLVDLFSGLQSSQNVYRGLCKSSKTLEKLEINCHLETLRDYRQLLELIQQCKNLQSLCLPKPMNRVIFFQEILGAMKKFQSNFREIKFKYLMNESEILEFLKFLSNCDNLEYLDISGGDLSYEASELLLKNLQRFQFSLKHLWLRLKLNNFHSDILKVFLNFPYLEDVRFGNSYGYLPFRDDVEKLFNRHHFTYGTV